MKGQPETSLTSTDVLEAERVLSEQLAREDAMPPRIGDRVLRTCLALALKWLEEDHVDTSRGPSGGSP